MAHSPNPVDDGTEPQDRPPTVRRISLDYPPEFDPSWIPARPEFACAANSVSLLMPHMEPYFVRSMHAVVDELGPELATRTRAYIGQESQHHHQHRVFNRHLIERYPRLIRVEAGAARAYRWLGNTRQPGFNVAVAAASETIAYSAARWSAERRRELFAGADPVVSTLFLWHLAEEVEHKAIAWDVHRATTPSPGRARWRYLIASLVALALVMVFVGAGTVVMLGAERRLLNPLAVARLGWWAVTFAFELLTNLTLSLLPGHHPNSFVDPLFFQLWLQEHDASSSTVQVWHRVGSDGPRPATWEE